MACKEATNKEIKKLAEAYIAATKEGNSKVKAAKRLEKYDASMFNKVQAALSEIHVSSLISGFTTHLGNIVSPALNGVLVPTQRAIGRLLSTNPDPKESINEIASVYRIYKQAAVSGKMAVQSLINERNYLDTATQYIDQIGPRNSMSADAFGVENKVGRVAIDSIGTAGRLLGTRIMGSADELMSQMSYRGQVEDYYFRQALSEGNTRAGAAAAAAESLENHMLRFYKAGSLDPVNSTKRKFFEGRTLTPEQLAENEANTAFNAQLKAKYDSQKKKGKKLSKHAKEFNQKLDAQYNKEKRKVFNEKGLTELEEAINLEAKRHNDLIKIHEDALQYSREFGFKEELDHTSSTAHAIGSGLGKILEALPMLRLVVPFNRTPTLLMQAGVRNTPVLQQLSRSWWKDVKGINGTAKQAKAKGELATAWMTFFAVMPLIDSGYITGSVSSDWEVERNAADNGTQPYAFEIGGESVQYNYLDPVMFNIGIMADVRRNMREQDLDWQDLLSNEEAAESWYELSEALMFSTMSYMREKSTLQGLSGLFDVLAEEKDPKGAWDRYIRKQAAGFSPNMLSQANQITLDNQRREVRTFAEAFKAKLPFLSQSLPLKYDPLGIPTRHPERFYYGLPIKNSKQGNKLDRKKKDDYVRTEIERLSRKYDKAILPFHPTTANGKMDYRDYFKHGVKEGKSGESFYDAVNELLFERGEMVDAVYDLVTDKDYQAVEGEVVSEFDEFLGEDFKHTDYPSSQIQDINSVLKEHRTRAIEDLLQKDEWLHVQEAYDKFMLGYETQRQFRLQ
jgi:hypothetical protein